MVKENELLKGILVYLNGYNNILEVVDVTNLRELSAVFADGTHSEVGRLEGIPLTKEWVEKLGFKDQTGGWGGSTGYDYIYKKLGIEVRTYDYDNYWHSVPGDRKFEFVHQLQNYFFERTGKMLGATLK